MHRRFPTIELLRFILSVSVVIYHYFYLGPSIRIVPNAPAITTIGPFLLLSVETFFIISGFVILYSAAERSNTEFALARFTRLGPTLFVCSTLTYLVLIVLPLHDRLSPNLREWFVSVLVLPLAVENGVDPSLWSLQYEVVFYVLIFAVLSVGITSRRIVWIAWGLLISDLVYAVSWACDKGDSLSWWPMGHYGAFFVLGTLYCLRSSGARQPLVIWFAAVVMALVDCRLELWRVETQMLWHVMPAFTTSLLAGVITIGAFFSFARSAEITPAMARAFSLLGSASYPLYVVHQLLGYRLIAWADKATALDPTLINLGVLGLMVLFAVIFAALLERPLMDEYRSFGQRIMPRGRARNIAPLPETHFQN